jgi:hypothetical protein
MNGSRRNDGLAVNRQAVEPTKSRATGGNASNSVPGTGLVVIGSFRARRSRSGAFRAPGVRPFGAAAARAGVCIEFGAWHPIGRYRLIPCEAFPFRRVSRAGRG